MRGLLLLATAVFAGCATTTTVVGREQRTARFQVTSDPAGAEVYLGQDPRGQTPTTLEVPYTLVEKAVHPAERKQGWWLLGTGLGAMVTGAGIGVWGFSGIGDEDSAPCPPCGLPGSGWHSGRT